MEKETNYSYYSKSNFDIYIRTTADGSIFIGETTNLEQRNKDYNNKQSRKSNLLHVFKGIDLPASNTKKNHHDTEIINLLLKSDSWFRQSRVAREEFVIPQGDQLSHEERLQWLVEKAKEAIEVYSGKRQYPRTKKVNSRKEQDDCIKAVLSSIKKWQKTPSDKNSSFLINAIMRFGKTLTTLRAFQESPMDVGAWVSSTPSVHGEVESTIEDFVELRGVTCVNQEQYKLMTLAELRQLVNKTQENNEKIIFVMSLQFLDGKEGSKEKFDYLCSLNKLLMVDECDFGTRSAEHKKTIASLDTQHTFRVEMTGTAFRVLDEFLPENTFIFDYYEEQRQKKNDPESFKDRVTLQLYAINLFDTLKNQSKFWDEDGSFHIRRFFENASNAGWFVKQQFKYFDETEHNNPTRHYSLLDLYKGQVCVRNTHQLWFCPSRKAAKNLATALQKNHHAKRDYAVLNVSSDECSNDAAKTSEEVERHINNAEADNKKAIVLSVGKLKRGNTLKKIDTAVMLDNGESYENWFQAVCRAKSYRDGKDFCFIVDFNPTRTFVMMWQFAESVAKSQNLNLDKELFEQIIGSTFNPYIYGEYGIKQRRLSFEDAFKEAKSIDRVLRSISNVCVDLAAIGTSQLNKLAGFSSIGKKDAKLVENLAQIAKGNSGQSVRRNTEASAKEQDKQEKEQQALIEKIQSILNNLPRVLAIFPEITSLDSFYQVFPEVNNDWFYGFDQNFFKTVFNQNDLQDKIVSFRLATTDLSMLEVLKTINRYHISKDQIPTPFVLVKQMVDKLFNYATITIDTTFCDPYTKSGEYLAYLCERLMKNPEHVERFPNEEKRKQHILNKQLFGFSHDLPSLETTNHFLYGNRKFDGNVKLVNLEELQQMTKQFDVVVGNPPYQAPKKRTKETNSGSCGKSLWGSFVQLSCTLCKQDGYISLIHPANWRKPEHKLMSEFKNRNLLYLEIHNLKDGLKTFGCSTRYDWYVLKNNNDYQITVIKDEDGVEQEVNITSMPFIPNKSLSLFSMILGEGEENRVMYSRSAYGSDKKHMSKEKDEEFKYPCVYQITKGKGVEYWYSNRNDKGHFGIRKVLLSENGGFLGTCYDKHGEYGLTQFMFAIKVNTDEEAEGIIKAVNSEKFKAIWEGAQWMSNHREWRMFKHFRKDFWRDFV